MDSICEVYEPQWTGYDALQAQTAASESLWLDFSHKLGDQVLIPLNTYTGQFPEMKVFMSIPFYYLNKIKTLFVLLFVEKSGKTQQEIN